MAKLPRVFQKLFGGSAAAAAGGIGQFGSLAAGTPTFSIDPSVVQSLANWLGGWNSAVVGENSPALEDMNAVCFVLCYQLCYMMQQGIAEWDSQTTYFTGSLVTSGIKTYRSLTDNNLNNAVTSHTNWVCILGKGTRTVTTATDTASPDDGLILLDASAVSITATLPAVANSIGATVKYKVIGLTPTTSVTIQGNGVELIDFSNTQSIVTLGDTLELYCDGIKWYII